VADDKDNEKATFPQYEDVERIVLDDASPLSDAEAAHELRRWVDAFAVGPKYRA
jgi:hypothetical protein